MTLSAFLLQGNTGCSGGATNGTVLPTRNFSEKKEYLGSAFLLHGNTGRSGGTTNGTVLPTRNFSVKKGILLYLTFLVFTEMIGISLNQIASSHQNH